LQRVSREDHTVNSGARQLAVRLTRGLPLRQKSGRSPVRSIAAHHEAFTFQWDIVHVGVWVILASASDARGVAWRRLAAGLAGSGQPGGLVPSAARPLAVSDRKRRPSVAGPVPGEPNSGLSSDRRLESPCYARPYPDWR
jgi:hypothetical protein